MDWGAPDARRPEYWTAILKAFEERAAAHNAAAAKGYIANPKRAAMPPIPPFAQISTPAARALAQEIRAMLSQWSAPPSASDAPLSALHHPLAMEWLKHLDIPECAWLGMESAGMFLRACKNCLDALTVYRLTGRGRLSASCDWWSSRSGYGDNWADIISALKENAETEHYDDYAFDINCEFQAWRPIISAMRNVRVKPAMRAAHRMLYRIPAIAPAPPGASMFYRLWSYHDAANPGLHAIDFTADAKDATVVDDYFIDPPAPSSFPQFTVNPPDPQTPTWSNTWFLSGPIDNYWIDPSASFNFKS